MKAMQEYRFLVQGSAADPYEVHFIQKDGSNLSAYCSCPAGSNGMYCKHRMNILAGLVDGIVSPNAQDVATVHSWLPGTDIERAMQEVVALEKEAEAIKKRLGSAKKSLAKAMLD